MSANGEERSAQRGKWESSTFQGLIIMMLEYSPSGFWQIEVARTFSNFEIISVVYCLIVSSVILYKKWKELIILHHKTTWETVQVIKCIHRE